jgi:isopentenyldiphosphate isomerase
MSELKEVFSFDSKRTSIKDEVYLYFSFDLVNSTAFKDSYPLHWPTVISRFYELTRQYILDRLSPIKVWKYIGDEVLFYKKIHNLADIYPCPKEALNIMQQVSTDLNKQFTNLNFPFSIKAAIWIAKVSPNQPTLGQTQKLDYSKLQKNIIIDRSGADVEIESTEPYIDFLGPDIDIGFRICKCINQNKLGIESKLAYILYQNKDEIRFKEKYDIERKARIVSYKALKGVWKNRLYPIIWYYDDWANEEDVFQYDELFSFEVQISESKFEHYSLRDKKAQISQIDKIFRDLNRLDEIQEILDTIDQTIQKPVDTVKKIKAIPKDRQTEVHCVGVCFNNDGNIFLARRHKDKKNFSEKWEFGCAQLSISETFKSCLDNYYSKEFGFNIEFKDNLPIPIKVYDFVSSKDGRTIPGVIFVAFVKDYSNLKIDTTQHSEYTWFAPSEIPNISIDDYIDGFQDTVSIAKEFYDKWTEVEVQHSS